MPLEQSSSSAQLPTHYLIARLLIAFLLELFLATGQITFASSPFAKIDYAQSKLEVAASPSSDSEESILAEADSLYWQSKYNEALPLYIKLADLNSNRAICDGPVKLHRLADLADCYARLEEYDRALPLYERILSVHTKHYGRDSVATAIDMTNVAACYYYREHFNKAQRLCEQSLAILDKARSPNSDTVAKVCLELGEVHYSETKFAEAAKAYARAVTLYDRSQGDIVELLLLALQGEAACYYRDRQYQKAVPILERLADIERTIHGSDDVRYGWALMNLSDVYRKLGKLERAKPSYDKCIQIFRRVNIERILAEGESKGTLTKKEQANVYEHMFGHVNDEHIQDLQADVEAALQKHRSTLRGMQCFPSERSLAKQGPWNLITTDRIDPPAWLWMDPKVRQKVTLVCVHGLGLNARTYESFARALAPRGFTTLAIDMRGFGTYSSLKGKERADFAGSLEDLQAVLKSMRSGKSPTPVFILGESMGGAIALQFTARYPELVDGLICAVPAGTHYKAKKTELQVAVRLIKDANKPFDIGKQVVSQATAKTSLKKAWAADPFNRLELTPKELIEYQAFMNQNKSAANKIKDRPVIFFQGGQDKLIKAQGTMSIFKEVASPDKDLVLLGSSEHLIFEEGQFNSSVIYDVLGWVLAHMPEQDNLTASK